MYTNPHNIILSLVNLLNNHEQQINMIVREFQSMRRLTVLEGARQVIPVTAYPTFEIEPDNGANSWATTRAQRPRYTFTCTLTVSNSNEKYGVEYVTTMANTLTEIMCSPENLQLRILNETKWNPNSGLVDTYFLDSLVEDVSYSSTREGTMRVATFNWFVLVHEPFPESKWVIGNSNQPVVLRPAIV